MDGVVYFSVIDLSYRERVELTVEYREMSMISGVAGADEVPEFKITKLELPFATVAVPLALISAWLLLGKPR